MRIAVVGLGAVGEACALTLTVSEVARSLVLLNRSENVAPAIAADLRQARAWGQPLDTEVGALTDWQLLHGCDLILLTLGTRLKGDQKRSEMAASTASLLRGRGEEKEKGFLRSLRKLKEAAGEHEVPLVLVISNPVEATVSWLVQQTGWPRQRMFGLGTTVESARFSGFLAEELDVDAHSVWVDIVGEHAELFEPLDVSRLMSMFPQGKIKKALLAAEQETRYAAKTIRTLSEKLGDKRAAKVAEDLREAMKDQMEPEALDTICTWLHEDLRRRLAPPATRYAIAASANRVARAIRENLSQVLTVSAFPTARLGLPDVALALPFVVGREGLGECLIDKVPEVVKEAAKGIQEQISRMDQLD